MDFLGKRPEPAQSTTARGKQAEDTALAYLQARGLKLVERNYRTPGRGGGEIDLILRDRDGSLVFVEVRSRNTDRFGGAGGSIGRGKQQRIVLAARHYLMRWAAPPACRFDVVLVQVSGGPASVEWLQAAFEAL